MGIVADVFRVPDRLFGRLVIGAVIVGFTVLILVGMLAAYVVRQNIEHTELVGHTYQVESTLSQFRILQERLETARRGYLIGKDERFYRTFRETSDLLPALLQQLDVLTIDNPKQQDRLRRLTNLIAQQRVVAEVSISNARSVGFALGGDFVNDPGVKLITEIRAIAAEMAQSEERLLVRRNAQRQDSIRSLIVVMSIAGALMIFVAVGSTGVIFRYTRDLTTSRDALSAMNEGLEDAVQVRTADLQRANDEIQRFAYIVSHDLRAPLVNIMGFTSELEASAKPLNALLARAEEAAPQIVTPEARAAIRDDLPESIGFIRSSSQKMDRLINAILQLSRQGRRVLAPQRVEMEALMTSIAASLQHRVHELGAEITVAPGLPAVVSDRLALEQIFSNLIENATKYLQPGRPGRIRVSGHREGSRIVYEVADNGRGIAPKDHERIFDLFRRSGAQDQPGEGIGLAHVRALAYRLGGTVSCESALDQGATFRVSLPTQLTGEGLQA
jgi:signal transduction histidine kinase